MKTHHPDVKGARAVGFKERIAALDDSEAPPGIFEALNAVRRNLWIIILIVVAAVGLAHLHLKIERSLFTARSEIFLEERKSPVDLGELLAPSRDADSGIQTELEVVRSRAVLRDVIEKLNLLDDPEFNPTIPTDMQPWERWIDEVVSRPVDLRWEWPPSLGLGPPPEPQPIQKGEAQMRVAIDRLRAKTGSGSIRYTTIIWVSVTAWLPEKAALIANEIAQAYLRARVQAKIDAQRFASEFIGERVLELRREVEAAEAAVQAFRSENAILGENSPEVARFEDLQARYEAALALVQTLHERLDRFEDLRENGGLEAAGRALGDTRLTTLIDAGYEERLPEEIDRVLSRLRNDLAVAERRVVALRESRDELQATLREDAANLVALRQLEREAEASKVLFETFLTRQKETAAQESLLLTADARLLTVAEPPYGPSSPVPLRVYGIGTAAGLVIAFVLVFLLERGRNRFVNIEELEAFTEYSVLGSIPRYAKSRERRAVLKHVRATPGGSIAEAVRNLRTSILLANVDTPPQVVTLTSSVPEEGKSLTAILLGIVSSQMGKKTILLDVDLRRRMLHHTFRIKAEPGLIGVLDGSASLEDAIRTDVGSGLHVMCVEKTRASPPDLLSSEAFAEVISKLREQYELILLDAPPILPVTDARILSKIGDGIVYIVKWNDTPRDIVRHGLASLESVGARISGLVLTQVDRKKQRRYGYGYYGYYGRGNYRYYRKADRYYTD